MVLGQICLQPKQSQHCKQTYKVLKSYKLVCRVLSLQGEEAVSNVIKLALILENGSSWSLSGNGLCALSLASELTFWQGH